MKILVMSDSHHMENLLSRMIEAHRDADAFVFLGDGIGDFEEALAENGLDYTDRNKEISAVYGNCDLYGRCGGHLVREFSGLRFYLTHGAEEGVKTGVWTLVEEAARNDCQVALFGHTHHPFFSEKKGIYLFNPGTAARGEYGMIEISGGVPSFRHEKFI